MSYSIGIYVKVEGCDKYAEIAHPSYSSPSYNLGKLFRNCMNWNFKPGEYYRCDHVIEYLDIGIRELTYKPNTYAKLIPALSIGTTLCALDVLNSTRDCILEQAEDIPPEYMYMRWE